MLRRIGMELSYDFISHYQYLAANAITGTLVLSATGRESRIVYPYHLRIKVLQALEIAQKLSDEDLVKPFSHFQTDVHLIRIILNDIRANFESDNSKRP